MKPTPAEAFPLCDYLHDELTARCWGRADLLRRVEMGEDRLTTILSSEDELITMNEAEQLGRAFGVSAELFLRLQSAYRNWKTEG